jgi:2-dehydro-3-deoxyphosphogluconate aldolase / (4S)-4-hydroxy-2-oxoglutarate aldolase
MPSFDDVFDGTSLMAILRGFPPERTVELAERAWDLGFAAVEVPIGSPDQVPSLAAAVRAGAERGRSVGAGTIVTIDLVRVAAEVGAAYTVAPGLDLDVLAASAASGLPHLPGVATASEVQRARAAGCDWVKAFPASSLGPSWFRDIRGPFPHVRYVATGGLDGHSAGSFLAAGATVVGVGPALADPAQQDLLARLVRGSASRTPADRGVPSAS